MAIIFLILLCIYFPATSGHVPTIFTFGDSIVDAGNNQYKGNCLAQANFTPYGSTFFHYPTGRPTDGRIIPDFIDEYIGLDYQKPYLELYLNISHGQLKRYPTNGINFAGSGAGLLSQTFAHLHVIPLKEQLFYFRTLVETNQLKKELVKNSFFLLSCGTNDIFTYFEKTRKMNQNAYRQAMLTEAEIFLSEIIKLGARRIVVFTLLPSGCSPGRLKYLGGPLSKCNGKVNLLTKQYNRDLEVLIHNLSSKYSGVTSVYADLYKVFQQIRKYPANYGFTEVSTACCGGGPLGGLIKCGEPGYTKCDNPDKYVFWDLGHSTEHVYKVMTDNFWNGPRSIIRPMNLKSLANM